MARPGRAETADDDDFDVSLAADADARDDGASLVTPLLLAGGVLVVLALGVVGFRRWMVGRD